MIRRPRLAELERIFREEMAEVRLVSILFWLLILRSWDPVPLAQDSCTCKRVSVFDHQKTDGDFGMFSSVIWKRPHCGFDSFRRSIGALFSCLLFLKLLRLHVTLPSGEPERTCFCRQPTRISTSSRVIMLGWFLLGNLLLSLFHLCSRATCKGLDRSWLKYGTGAGY